MDVGKIFENKYEILELIGKGGMSNVYLALDINTQIKWAIKEYKKSSENQYVQIYHLMISEANMIAHLHHPSIPRILDIIDTDASLIIIMDYIEGKTIDRIIQEGYTFSEETVINLARQLIDVFCFLHSKNIIYRDLKPANIMLQPNNKIMLIDFGIAREFSPKKEQDTVCLGTKGYAAPEQYGGRGQTDSRTDIYGFGVTLFYMLTGINPMEDSLKSFRLKNVNMNFSYSLDYIISKCTQLNPDDRYQNFKEVDADFASIKTLEQSLKRKYLLKNIFKRKDNKSEKIFKNIEGSLLVNPINSLFIDSIPILPEFGETTILSGADDNNYQLPPSVMDRQEIQIFLSYCNHDSDLADIICDKFNSFSFIKISRYTINVPYKSSFREFMNTLGEHDKVIMIVSDQYLKSRACMYEVGKLINSPNFQHKILFIVCSNKDKKYYKSSLEENIEAKIYDPHMRNQYIIFWEKQCRLLEDDLKIIENECAKIEILEIIRDIKKIISSDIGLFMKYLADVRGISFDELYEHEFDEFLRELKVEDTD